MKCQRHCSPTFLIFAAIFFQFCGISQAGAGASLAAAPAPHDNGTTSWYHPPRLVNWQYQLSDNGKITYIPGVQMYIIDLDTARTQLKALKSRSPSAKIICYFSAGSYEDFRVDDDRNRGMYSINPNEWKGLL